MASIGKSSIEGCGGLGDSFALEELVERREILFGSLRSLVNARNNRALAVTEGSPVGTDFTLDPEWQALSREVAAAEQAISDYHQPSQI